MVVFRRPDGGPQVFCCCLPCAMILALGIAGVLITLATVLWAR